MEIRPLGERALTVYFDEGISEEISGKVHALVKALKGLECTYIHDIVPGYRTVTIHYDPLHASYQELVDLMLDLPSLFPPERERGKTLKVPVVYGGVYGPDLEYVANYHGISPEDVIRLHTSKDYLVYMLGFSPGFTYLGELPSEIHTPRLRTPRKRVPPGSVGIAGAQTGIYAVSSPGGWQIIGRTPLKFFDPKKRPPVPVRPGDRIRFFPISEGEFSIDESSVKESPHIDFPIFKILNPGPLSIIVDGGRKGYRDIGMSESGPMDYTSFVLSNLLLGGRKDLPSIEIFLSGFSIEVLSDTMISLVGGSFEIFINDRKFYSNGRFSLKKGDVLRVGKRISGMRLYLSIPGGIDAPYLLGSASLDLKGGIGGLYGRPLRRGDLIPVKRGVDFSMGYFLKEIPVVPDGPITLRFVPGPDLDHFRGDALSVLTSSLYKVTQAMDRMGYRIEGPLIPHSEKGAGILSDGVIPGVIQVPGDGMPIVMMKDAQPLGGYAKIGVVVEPDLDRLSQVPPGTGVRFSPVTLDEAQRIYREERTGIGERYIVRRVREFLVKIGEKRYDVEVEGPFED